MIADTLKLSSVLIIFFKNYLNNSLIQRLIYLKESNYSYSSCNKTEKLTSEVNG